MNDYHDVTVHYSNGQQYTFRYVGVDSKLFELGVLWYHWTVVFEKSQLTLNTGYFEVVEVTEDKTEVWLEYKVE